MELNNNIKKDKTLNVRDLINERKKSKTISQYIEKMVPHFLKIVTAISILTTCFIVFTLLTETVSFFKQVPLLDFFSGTKLQPISQNPEFVVLALVIVTLYSILIAMMVTAPIGLMSGIYLSEYASDKLRKIMKPLLVILAGIPTIVYGFFAFTFVTP